MRTQRKTERGSVLAESAMVTAFAIFTSLASLNLHFFIDAYSKARSITYEIGRNASATPGMHLVNWEDPKNRQRSLVMNQASSLFSGYGVNSQGAEVIVQYNETDGMITVVTRMLVENFRPAFYLAPEARTSADYVYLVPVQ